MSFWATTGPQAYRLYQLAWDSVDWLYPPRCGGCDKPGSRWCEDCQKKVVSIQSPVCDRCGAPNPQVGSCADCLVTPPPFAAMRSKAEYVGVIREAILRLKFAGDLGLAENLSRYLIELYLETNWQVDLVVPVPAGRSRHRHRGYNQAALLAFPLALKTGLQFRPQALKKIVDTRSQVGLNHAQRHQNVARAFQALPEMVAGRKVLIVDDITTSGATLLECTRACHQAQASRVYALTLARASLEMHQPVDSSR